MQNPFRGQKAFWTVARRRSMYAGAALLAVAIVIQIVLGQYGARASGGAGWAHDLFLDYLPIVNLGFVIVAGAIATWVLAWWLMAVDPKKLIFGTKAVALFIICRAFFTSLTHLGPYPGAAMPSTANDGWWLYHRLTFEGNFFFSGHTGFPFLIALIFWDSNLWRRVFLALTVLFGAAMLLSHTHYSIDVFAAPFMVYGTYRIAEIWFKEDRKLAEQISNR